MTEDAITRDAKASALARHLLGGEPRASAASEPERVAPVDQVSTTTRAPFDYLKALSFARWYDGWLRVHQAAAEAMTSETSAPADDELLKTIVDVHRMLLSHPAASQAAFRALVEEGRRHATTEEGARTLRQLSRSPRMRSAAHLFRSLSLGMLRPDPDGALPSSYLDNLLQLVDHDRVEATFASWLESLGRRG
ncbi:MAG: hypothetical protein KC731_21690 [Myxococcales bacterium]|nr:hypothetical protein [Myxococcales bacterium]